MNVNNRTDINSVLSQMRTMRSQMQSSTQNTAAINNATQAPSRTNEIQSSSEPQAVQGLDRVTSVDKTTAPSFADMFKSAIDTVNETQQSSSSLATRYSQGDESIDLPEVMIAAQKASVSFQALTQVRNKVVEAYKEVMNMPI
jgi:flagellar hook-basal body complex protein FliE